MTICENCQYFLVEGDSWYQQYCKAFPLVKDYNFQLGKGEERRWEYNTATKAGDFVITRELDRKDLVTDLYWSDQTYQFASRINTSGECPKFKDI